MLLLPIQMYGQQQGYGTDDSNKILSEFGKSAYKMMMDAQNPNNLPTNPIKDRMMERLQENPMKSMMMNRLQGSVNPTNKDLEFIQKNMDAFDRNPLGFDKDPSGQFYIDNTGSPIDRDAYNYIMQDIENQQNDALKDVNPDKFGIGGLLDKIQFYKR